MPLVLEVHYAWKKQIYLDFCENKLRPQLKCDGKCAFAKMLKKTASDLMPVKPDAKVGKKWDEMQVQIGIRLPMQRYTLKHFRPENSSHFPEGISADIFHPPQVA